MRSQTATIITIAIAAALVCVQSSAAAEAPLLSGYGGPGAGEQQIIGSGLVNGGGSTHGGAETPASSGLSEGESGGVSGSGSSNQSGRQSGTSGANGGGASKDASGKAGKEDKAGKGSRPAAEHGVAAVLGGGSSSPPSSPAASSATTALSDTELLLVAGIALALALIAVLTWRLGRSERDGGSGAAPGAREIRGAGS